MALDVLRVLQREPEAAEVVLDELAGSVSGSTYLKAGLERVQAILHQPRDIDRNARTLVEALAVVTAGALLQNNAPAHVADTFVASRLDGQPRATYGHGIASAAMRDIIDRALPPAQ